MSTAPLGQAPRARWKQTRSQISSSRYSHLQNVMDLRISQLVVAPIRVELHCTPTIDLPVSAVRFTHNTVDGHPVFLHDENAQSKKTSLWTFHTKAFGTKACIMVKSVKCVRVSVNFKHLLRYAVPCRILATGLCIEWDQG